MVTCLFRFSIALIPWIFILKKTISSIKQLFSHFYDFALISFIGVFLFNYFFFLGLKNTSPINASLLVATNPLSTSLLAVLFFKDRTLTRNKVLLILSSIFGVFVIFSKGKISTFTGYGFAVGDIYIFIATLCFSLSTIFVKKRLSSISPLTITLNTTLLSIIPFLILSIPYLKTDILKNLSNNYWYSCIEIGILGTSVAYFLWNKSILILGYSLSSLFLNLVPFFTILISYFIVGRIEVYSIIGGIVIISSIFLYDRVK